MSTSPLTDAHRAQCLRSLLCQGVLPVLQPATLLLLGGEGEWLDRAWLQGAYRDAVPAGRLSCWPVGADADPNLATPEWALTETGRFELAIVVDLLERVRKATAQALLSRLRDLYARRLLLVVDVARARERAWTETELLALGFYRWGDTGTGRAHGAACGAACGTGNGVATTPDAAINTRSEAGTHSGTLLCYVFDLYDYKLTPEWLNNRFWAHPERFDQDWW